MSEALKTILSFAGQRKWLLVLACFFSLASVLLTIVPFAMVYSIIRDLFLYADNLQAIQSKQLTTYGLIALFALVASFICLYIGLICSHVAAYHVLYNIRIQISNKLAKLPLGYFTKETVGGIKKTVDSNVEKIEQFIGHQIPDLVNAIVLPIAMITAMFLIDWRLALAVIIPIIVSYFIQWFVFSSKQARNAMVEYQNSLEKMSASGVEYIKGMPAVKIFGMTMETFFKFKSSINGFKDWAVKFTKVSRTPYLLYITILTSLLTFVLPVGVFILSGDPENQSFAITLLLFLTVVPSVATPMMQLMNFGGDLQTILEGTTRIKQILDEKEVVNAKQTRKPVSYDVEFRDVSFSYQKDEEQQPLALKQVSFLAKQGEVTALVGPSGSGKSTIASLIPRFWDVDEGAILVGGIPIEQIDIDDLMKYVSFVFQDVHLLYDSIEENIRMGNKKSTMKDIERAAKLACCHDFIMSLPNGYQTKIGESGVYLSGGEAQRITIARAILKDSPIIVLDEATAAADPENEANIQKGINALIKNKTVITIVHRLSSIKNANQIVVMNNGMIHERGVHEELIAKENLYSRMWQAHVQSKGWKLGSGEEAMK